MKINPSLFPLVRHKVSYCNQLKTNKIYVNKDSQYKLVFYTLFTMNWRVVTSYYSVRAWERTFGFVWWISLHKTPFIYLIRPYLGLKIWDILKMIIISTIIWVHKCFTERQFNIKFQRYNNFWRDFVAIYVHV